MNIGLGITGSFCTYSKILKQVDRLVTLKHNVIPIVSKAVFETDTRFGEHEEFLKALKEKTGNEIVSSFVDAEPLGPQNKIDIMVVAPCTGNTLSKLANGLSDDGVTMACKAHMRNYKPVVIAISTNDGLGLNMKNLATLMNEKNVFFVPFCQDDPQKKPKSLVADLSKLIDTIEEAKNFRQIQPVIL